MKILISLETPSLCNHLVSLANVLPANIKEQLVKERKFWRDLPMRLVKLPEIKKGIRVGTFPKVTVHENAVSYAARNKLSLYVGYIVYRDEAGDNYKIEVHSFCVDKNNRVIEPTDGFNWNESRYVGIPVPKRDVSGMRYLTLFERMDYINKALANHEEYYTDQAGIV